MLITINKFIILDEKWLKTGEQMRSLVSKLFAHDL
jgi:hypothetical protein